MTNPLAKAPADDTDSIKLNEAEMTEDELADLVPRSPPATYPIRRATRCPLPRAGA